MKQTTINKNGIIKICKYWHIYLNVCQVQKRRGNLVSGLKSILYSHFGRFGGFAYQATAGDLKELNAKRFCHCFNNGSFAGS